jgi:glycerol-3-phosphate dehydrogenase
VNRTDHIERLKSQEFDLVVIGGGITGAGIARDAAMRGLSVALVEARDFASGTSSKSSKLLHGGIRYLEQFHLHLVFEASRERRLHSDLLAPHLAHPVPFLIPVYPWSPHGYFAVAAGVHLYDALALFRNHGTRVLGKDKALAEEPRLESRGLKGGVVYHDVVMDDARLALENVRSAAHHGAIVCNYLLVRGFEKDGTGRLRGVWVKDATKKGSGDDFRIRGKAYVNASGPWSDYIRRLDNPDAEFRLRPTKGVHIVLPNECLGKTHAFVLTAKADNRVFFSIPWYGRTLVGTTDTDYDPATDGQINDIRAFKNEIDYIMEGVFRTFPGASVTDKDIISSFAGLRPLVAPAGEKDPSAVSREHLIWQEPSGLITIAGGKYTTYRVMAAQTVDRVVKHLASEYASFGQKRFHHEVTHLEAIVLPSTAKERDHFAGAMQDYTNTLSAETVAHLQQRYGARWQFVADLAMQNTDARERIMPGELDIKAEAAYAKSEEMAVHAEDFFRRRTMLALKSPLAQEFERVKGIAAQFGDTVDKKTVETWQGITRQENPKQPTPAAAAPVLSETKS